MRFTVSCTGGMESAHAAEETHARSPQHAQATPCHRGCHGRDISTQQKSIIVSDGSNLSRSVDPRSGFILPNLVSMGGWRVEQDRRSLPRPSPASVAATSRFGAWSRSSSQTRQVSTLALWNKRHKQPPLPASGTPTLSPSRQAAKRRCLPESLPSELPESISRIPCAR